MTSDRKKARFVREEVRHIYITRHEVKSCLLDQFLCPVGKTEVKGSDSK